MASRPESAAAVTGDDADRRLPKRRRAVAASTDIGFPREFTGRRRMGNAAPPCRQRRIGKAAQATLRPGSEPLAVERTRSADEGGRDHLARIARGVPALVSARDLVDRFHQMVRDRAPAVLPPLIGDLVASILASFGKGIAADRAAVTAALVEPWSNGQTEGQITKLKLVKRQMYGRAKLDLPPRSPYRSGLALCIESAPEPLFHADPQAHLAPGLAGVQIWLVVVALLHRRRLYAPTNTGSSAGFRAASVRGGARNPPKQAEVIVAVGPLWQLWALPSEAGRGSACGPGRFTTSRGPAALNDG